MIFQAPEMHLQLRVAPAGVFSNIPPAEAKVGYGRCPCC